MPAMPAAPDQERTEIEPVEPVDRNFTPKSENVMLQYARTKILVR